MSTTPPEMPDLSPQQIELFTPIIDKILDNADLTTITPKKIINGLQEKLGYDITEFKKEVKKLINQRFDVASAKQDATNTTSTPQSSTTITNTKNHKPATNGTSTTSTITANKSHKRPSPSSSTTSSSPPPKKHKSSSTPKQGKSMESLDAELAARLQAEENGRARSTRGGSGATSSTVRKRGTPSGKKGGAADLGSAKKKKRVSKATLDSADDSEMEGSGVEKKEKEKKGGFHKPMVLSQTLSEFFGGEEKLSRPECVKRIWAYIKEHDLQDPKDRRQIRCDDKLRRVFKQDRVTMFNMNKHLSFNLYPPEEV